MDEDNKKQAGEEWVDQILKDIRSEGNQGQESPAEEPTGLFERQPPQTRPPQKQPPKRQEPPKKTGKRRKRVRVKRVGYANTLVYLVVSAAICIAASVFCLKAMGDILAISKPDMAVEVEVPEGVDTAGLGEIYQEAGLIDYPWVFEIVAKYEGIGEIAPGTYVLNRNMGYTSLMDAVQKSSQPRETVNVTIPEGLTLSQIAKVLEENKVCSASDFMRTVENTSFGYDFEEAIPDDGQIYHRLEGYLFPDTYEFYTNEAPLNVAKRMMDNFNRKITPEIRAQMKEQEMTLHELLTLASIIQGEAPDTENMAMVSSVYHNRLDNPSEFPKLQADPTRKYASEEIESVSGVDGRMMADAYNTYEGKGLPPGPINNPGIAAIEAALNPAETDYYYFCSDLKTREFFYAVTLEEHEQNLRKANLK